MLSRKPIKETIYPSPSSFFAGALWIPVSIGMLAMAALFTAALISGTGYFLREKRYAVWILLIAADLVSLVGLYFSVWDGAVRITLDYEGVKAKFFGRELTSFSWSEVRYVFVQDQTFRGTEKYLMLTKADVEAKDQYLAARSAKHCMSENEDILLMIPFRLKRSQMIRQFAPDRVRMRYLEKLKR